jgi:glucosamine--fructose-6-phosphate aminotransferase (isomerizing)
MCGIFGYVGKSTDVAGMVLAGLKTLEYRGYDSWGIAVLADDALHIERHVGKIGTATTAAINTTIGIGHTRWATHGGVTVENAHPQTDEGHTLALVHNGIIENNTALRESLSSHNFTSKTDTEVMVHLVEQEMADGSPFVDAVARAFAQVQGLNAFVILSKKDKTIVAVKNGSPLVVGRTDEGYYLASDIAGIIEHTKDVSFIKDGQMVVMDSQGISLYDAASGAPIRLEFAKTEWTFEQAQKGNFPHFLIKEIHDQPEILSRIAKTYGMRIDALVQELKRAQGVFFLGCGTASYAALCGTYLFSQIAAMHVNFSIGSEFRYWQDYVTDKTLVIPISQSGETIDVVQPVEEAKSRGARIAAITNVLGSTIYRQADTTLLLGAGQERAVISTKAFLAMISVLLYTAYEYVGEGAQARLLLENTSASLSESMLTEAYITTHIKPLATSLVDCDHMYILGRGLSYPAALEFALKMKETTYLHAEGFAGGELKHGVIALIEEGTPVVVLAPLDETYDEIISNAQEVSARGGHIIGVSPKPHAVFDRYIPIEDVGSASVMLEVVVSQLLAYYLAIEKGFEDPDKPRNLAKSVTVK